MRSHRSNIPAGLLEMRDRILNDLGLSAEDLPCAGELLEVKEEEARWQGALERVLSNFSSSILVRERHYPDLARYLDRTHLGLRVVYFRVKSPTGPIPDPLPNTLPSKFNIKGGPWAAWLRNELVRRFNYVCVESTAQFAHFPKAVTLAGQVKHNETRHEKDDRHHVNDKRWWKTGFSNEAKIAELEKEAAGIKAGMNSRIAEGKSLETALRTCGSLRDACRRLIETDWNDIDEATPRSRIAKITAELAELREGNDRLRELSERIAEAGARLNAAREKTRESLEKKTRAEEEEERRSRSLEETGKALSRITVNAALHPGIEALRASIGSRYKSPEALDDAEKRLLRLLGGRSSAERTDRMPRKT